nr:ATP-binding protein [Texcoconibacillus texcoconensis]
MSVRFDHRQFPFETTQEVQGLENGIIGQNRAVRAMEFGLEVKQQGYNLFMVGPAGTGKTTYALSKVNQVAANDQTPSDLVCVYNFKHHDEPLIVSFSAGKGTDFKHDIEELIQDITTEIRNVFESKEYEQKSNKLISEFEQKINQSWNELEEQAVEQGVKIQKTSQGMVPVPVNHQGQPLNDEIYQMLTEKQQEDIVQTVRNYQQKINDLMRKTQSTEKNLRKEIQEMEKQTVREAITYFVEQLINQYETHEKVVEYIQDLKEDVIHNWRDFYSHKDEEDQESLLSLAIDQTSKDEHRYQVNVLVDNSDVHGAPVIHESNPTYTNLFGKIEYKGMNGTAVTDFTKVKPGAIHLANGGYLIMQATDLLSHPFSYHALKRMLKTGYVRIENTLEERGLISTAGLKPEPIPVHIKIILIGTQEVYQLLCHADENFKKYFKVQVDFDTEMERHEDHCLKYAAFVSNYCQKEGLRHLSAEALGKVIDYSTRLIGDQRKLSTSFHEMTEILVESNYLAGKKGHALIETEHISLALQERFNRSNRLEKKIRALIEEGTIMVHTDGERVGQINGLAYLQEGHYTFGQPHKITARTFMGRSGIVHIERESLLSGRLHSKGLLILSGYLQGEFARYRPLPLAASITFEQTYSIIDGDSASSAELYALLSSLSDIPIQQGIAVTGSVNQRGEIQPIGGVNEKIEGFYYTCKGKGLTGNQGVIIPDQNVKNLMLNEDVLNAVEEGKFHVWAVKTIQEGIEILTAIEAGERNEHGQFPEGTVFDQVENKVSDMIKMMNKVKKQSNESIGNDGPE